MKITTLKSYIWLPASLLFSAGALSAEMRTFTNKDGKEISAEIVNVSGDTLTLKRDDGKTFDIAAATLSESDQVYIKTWSENNVSYDFIFQIDDETDTITQVDGHGHRFEERAKKMKIMVSENSGNPISDPKIEYKEYFRGEDPEIIEVKNIDLKPGTPAEFSTKPSLERSKGIWIRVYDGDKMIGEFKSKSSTVEKSEW